ncbi:hypothetical protein [Bartonella apis]|nr:hypothetical protein [Bartonella apis]
MQFTYRLTITLQNSFPLLYFEVSAMPFFAETMVKIAIHIN